MANRKMQRTITFLAVVLFVVDGKAVTPSTTNISVSATGSIGISGATIAGPATFTNGIPNGTLSAAVSLSAITSTTVTVPFTVTAGSGNILSGNLTLPAALLLGGGTGTGSAVTTLGTGVYAGDTYSFPSLATTGSLSGTTISVSFSGAGTLTTGGGGPSPSPTATIGIFRPPAPVGGALGFFVVDSNGNYVYDATDKVRQFGLAGDTPVAGDWDGTGVVRMGVFRCPAPGAGICTWYLDQNNNGQWDGTLGGDLAFQFGLPGDIPVVGDWNGNGISKVGVIRCPAVGQPGICSWFLDIQNLRAPSGDFFVGLYGVAGDQPAVGHWSGAGGTIPVDNIGVFRTGQWILNSGGSGFWVPSDRQYSYGLPGDIPVVGKWDGAADKRIGVFRCPAVGQAGTCTWILNTTGNGTFSASDLVTSYGLPGDKPVVGSWTVQ